METIKSKIATEDKPVVQYDPKRSETINLDFGSRFGAYVYALDHPRLGEMHVTTSSVLSYDEVTGVFETRNTVYVPFLG